ncbi:hypothetical protein DFP93_102143 [Aneurinibacillus soli]|uniref:Uncharacterized protein n=1 Tax=Aneurinibacillus soli TaxID=1500254 RepID=A0A0U4WFZ1_9BACL|nr:hypothetical protein DFP93_102143 [Aneurinibacillus soli]BAU27609.1 hypothetical protein CB4_01783 [Aneurinibacillus soli]
MRSFYERGRGRTLIPREKLETNTPGEVATYCLSPEELAKYQALPLDIGRYKKPISIPRRRKKA